MNDRFAKLTEETPVLFSALVKSEPLRKPWDAALKGRAGIYALFEKRQPVYVGRTRDLLARLYGHTKLSHFSATFAFKRARRMPDVPKKPRAELAKDPAFVPEFKRQIELVRDMEVRFVDVPGGPAQYLLELYACMQWELPLDEFNTH